jgi:peptidoglycan hydrolase-like protein with peptidoglycan-binding domain
MAISDRPEGNTVNLSRRLASIDTTVGIQRRLNQAGFNAGKEDGIYGPKTTAAVKRFQQFARDNAGGSDPRIIDSGPVDGIAGPITKAALLSFYGS